MFGPRPRLVRKGTAAAVAETAAAALVEHESARRVNLEMAAAAYDEALELDPLAEGRAKGAAAGDPLREGMIAHNMLDQAAIQQQQLAEVLEARAEEKKALAEALARVRELELSAAAALGLSAAGGRAAGLWGAGPSPARAGTRLPPSPGARPGPFPAGVGERRATPPRAAAVVVW